MEASSARVSDFVTDFDHQCNSTSDLDSRVVAPKGLYGGESKEP